MDRRQLKKLNLAEDARGVGERACRGGLCSFEEGAFEGLTPMGIYKSRAVCTRSLKKKGGEYVKLYAYTSPECAAEFEFVAVNAEKREKGHKKERYTAASITEKFKSNQMICAGQLKLPRTYALIITFIQLVRSMPYSRPISFKTRSTGARLST